MKAKITFSTLFCISILFLSGNYFTVLKDKKENTNRGKVQTYNLTGKFLIAAMHSGYDNTSDAYKRLADTLKMNSWHKYGSWFSGDTVDGNPGEISSGVTSRLSQNDSRDLRTVFQRPVTTYAAYGQRNDYQCENISYGADYWFYAYNTSISNTYVGDVSDSGGIVKHASLNGNGPGVWEGYLVKNLRSNREQCNKKIGHLLDRYNWYLRPRMRIPIGLNDTTKVCRIEVVDWNDTIRKTIELTARNFRASLSVYTGQYLDKFYFSDNPNLLTAIKLDPNQICPGPAKDPYAWKDDPMKTDYRVYWYGQCDLWIDFIRLEDEPARRLYEGELNTQINAEVNFAKANYDPDHPNFFYQEEFEFNHSPCIKKVNELIESASGNDLTLMVNLNVEMYNTVVPFYYDSSRFFYAEDIRKYLIDYADIKILIPVTYDLEGYRNDASHYPDNLESRASLSPSTLPVYSQSGNGSLSYDSSKGLLAYKTNPTEYDDWIQFRFDSLQKYNWKFTNIFKLCDTIVNRSGIALMNLHQTHSWYDGSYRLKEPTNQEMEVCANLAISYGAKGLLYFSYDGNVTDNGYSSNYGSNGTQFYYAGLGIDQNQNPRKINAYGQNKWDFFKKYNRALEKLGSYFMSFDNFNRKSYILRSEYSDLYSQTYFSDVITYRPFGGTPTCPEENPNSSVTGTYFECKEKRYLQVATFQNSEPNTKFFMIVNRRCSPFIDTINDENNGGRRFLKIKLDSSSTSFSGFNNWSIYNIENDSLIKTFDKSTRADINLGWYLPGEGKLYKLAPVMQEGGELVADESCFSSFTCNGEVYNEGFDIRLNPGTEISFSENGRLAMNGGSFISGYTESNQSDSPVILQGLSTRKWKGVSLNNCDEVNVINTSFSDISPEESGAVQLTNCLNTSIISSLFNSTDSAKTALSADYILNGGEWNVSLYLKNNQFINTVNSLKVISYGSTVIPVTIDGNSFAASVTGNNAVTLSNITAGIIKNNFISNYRNSMNMICCTADLYRNVITCSISNSVSISPSGMSCLNFGKSGDYYTGGINSIESDEANINTDNSDFNLNKGYNTFNIFNSSSSAYHFTGTFPESSGDTYLRAAKNCFQINSLNDNPLSSIVYNGTNLPVEFEFNPVNCDPFEPGEYTVLTVNGRNDTIYFENEPSGAGYKGGIQSNTSNPETESLNALYDSAKISARIRDYETAKLKCEEVLNSFADSIQAVNVISELYLSYLNTGNTENRMSELESNLETVILNHSENEALVNKCFYFIQKCKVSEREYLSAMTGFSQIVNQNPYSYEGLIASWDYAAVSLLAGDSGGTGAGKSGLIITNNEFQIKESEELREYSEEELMQIYVINDDPVLNTNKTEKTTITNTKATAGEDRKKIKLSVFNSLKAGNETDKDKMKILEEKDREGTAGEREKSDLRKMKTLREIIRLKKPADIREHISKVNSDLIRLSEAQAENNKVKYSSPLPEEFRMYQNYPNPFNPKTIISYELRITNFVKISVYDVLGKEVAILVNEVQHPGTYEIEFEGNNLASGVYFCRMESGEFKDIKRMVLIK